MIQGSKETKDKLVHRDLQELQEPVVLPDKLVRLEVQDNQVHLDHLGQRV